VSTADWLLMLHVSAAFSLVGGSVAAATLNVLAIRSERPSDAALLLGLIRRALPFIFAGVAGTFIFGVWLWHEKGYGFGSGWIWGALVLWVVATALGGAGGKGRETARELAQTLADAGDTATDELRAALRDPRGNGLTALSMLATAGVLVLMIWKPGA
jgi:uncharacterized membrane protein